jgi:hypothetical protein
MSPVTVEAVWKERHVVYRGQVSVPDPGGLYAGHALQASVAGTPGHHDPLGDAVGRGADGRRERKGRRATSGGKSSQQRALIAR